MDSTLALTWRRGHPSGCPPGLQLGKPLIVSHSPHTKAQAPVPVSALTVPELRTSAHRAGAASEGLVQGVLELPWGVRPCVDSEA